MSFIEEVDDIFNSKLDKECYSNFKEVYGHLLYDSVGRIKRLSRDIDKTLLYADMQLRLSFDSDLSDIGFAKKLALILNGVISIPICHCGNLIKYTNRDNGLYNLGCSHSCIRTLDIVEQRAKQTNGERYGKDYASQSCEFRDQVKQTNLDRRGVEYPGQSKEVQDKMRHTNLNRRGVEIPAQCKEIQEKMYATYLENNIDPIWNNILSNTHCRPLFSKAEYIGSSYDISYNWECTTCNLTYASYYYGGYVKACPACTKSRSIGEIELYNYIQSLIPGVEVLANDRTILSPKELDIYIPSLQLAFEYNGDYHHENKPEGYHENKTEKCLAKDITLHHILESDWKSNKDDIKLFILSLIK